MIPHARTALVLLVAALAGCSGGSKAKPTALVKGKVTLDGQPMATGKVVFEEAGDATFSLDVKDGAYEGQVSVGKKKVLINSYKTSTPAQQKGGTAVMTGQGYEQAYETNIIPARYNTASTETRDVKEGTNEFSFEVKSK